MGPWARSMVGGSLAHGRGLGKMIFKMISNLNQISKKFFDVKKVEKHVPSGRKQITQNKK